MRLVQSRSHVLAKFLALLVLAGFSTARLIVFQSEPESVPQGDGARFDIVIESSSDDMRGGGLGSRFFSPFSWVHHQLGAMQEAATNNVMQLMQQPSYHESQLRAQEQQLKQGFEGMLRHVGCQRYRNAMREYMQAASRNAIRAAQDVERAVSYGNSDADLAKEFTSQLLDTADEDGLEGARYDSSAVGDGSSIVMLSGATGMAPYEEREQAEEEQEAAMEQRISEQHDSAGSLYSYDDGPSTSGLPTNDEGTSTLLDLLLRASDQLLQQKRERSATLASLRAGGVLDQQDAIQLSEEQDELELNRDFGYIGEDEDTDDPIAAAALSYWKKRDLHNSIRSHFYTLSGESLFNAIFSFFDVNTDSPDPFLMMDDDGDDMMMSVSGDRPAGNTVLQSAGHFGHGAGLDIDMDGAADINLSLIDPVTGELNWDLVMLYVLLFAVAVVFTSALRSWLLLRAAMRLGSCGNGLQMGGHVLVPVMVERNGRLVRGHMFIPSDVDEEEGGAFKHDQSKSSAVKGEGLYFYQPPAEAEVRAEEEGRQMEVVSTVIHASDYVSGEQPPLEEALLPTRR